MVQEYLPFFSINFLGLVFIRIWIQSCLYDRYTSTDFGIITVATNLFRVVVIVAILVAFTTRNPSEKARNRLRYLSIISMMIGATLFLAASTLQNPAWLIWPACICSGFGIASGGGMWITLFTRMQPGEALLYTFFSLGLSAFLGFFLGLLPLTLSYLVAILMPPIAFLAFNRAEKVLNDRESLGAPTDMKGISDAGPDTVYDSEPKATFLRLTAGIVLFNIALGIARGFPHGSSIALPLALQAVHQMGALLLCLALIWWALGKRRVIKFSSLWNISVLLIVVGVLLLDIPGSTFHSFGATLISLANTFAIGLLWFSAYDISRHSSHASYVVLGFIWSIHLLPRELGRFAIWAAEPQATSAIAITTVLIFLLAGSFMFLLNDSIPRTRPFFAEFRKGVTEGLLKTRILEIAANKEVAVAAAKAVEAAAKSAKASQAMQSEAPDPSAVDSLEASLTNLRIKHSLSDREVEVIRLIAQGRSKSYIAKKLYLSENTVKTYVSNAYTKLNVHNKQELLDSLEKT